MGGAVDREGHRSGAAVAEDRDVTQARFGVALVVAGLFVAVLAGPFVGAGVAVAAGAALAVIGVGLYIDVNRDL